MSNIPPVTELTPTRQDDVEEVVSFYNQEIDAINQDPHRRTMWTPYTAEKITNLIEDPHSKFLIFREKLGEAAIGDISGGILLDKDFSAWDPLEIYPPNPWHFGKFLAKPGLGHALWLALLEYGETNDISMYVAEAWDFTYDGLPKDKLRQFYTSPGIGMEWRGTVVYKNNYYGNIIGNERPVNRFSYELNT